MVCSFVFEFWHSHRIVGGQLTLQGLVWSWHDEDMFDIWKVILFWSVNKWVVPCIIFSFSSRFKILYVCDRPNDQIKSMNEIQYGWETFQWTDFPYCEWMLCTAPFSHQDSTFLSSSPLVRFSHCEIRSHGSDPVKAVRRPENFIQFWHVAHFNWLESFATNSFDIEKLIRNLWYLSITKS